MKQTENFFLKLFEGTDKFDYKVINENWQKVDDAIDELLNGGNIAILPTMTIERVDGGYRITTTDAKTSQSFIIHDGEKGEPFTYEDFTEEQLADLKGDPGKGAYDYAKESGYTGTEAEFTQTFLKWDYTYGSEDLTPGSSPLPTGKLHFVYE